MADKKQEPTETTSEQFIRWLGSPASIILHTIFFSLMFLLVLTGWNLQDMLLALTTALSIEAIYLALFIQMTVNKASESLEDVEEDIDAIEEDIDAIQMDEKEDDKHGEAVAETLKKIDDRLSKLQADLDSLRKKA